MRSSSMARSIALLAPLALAVALARPLVVRAHEIPNDVVIHVYFKPEAPRLRVLVRAPLEAMTDIDWPMSGPGGVLDIARADPYLTDASTLWLGDNLQVLENGAPLPYPKVIGVRASQPGDGAFQSYDQALKQLLGPKLPPDTQLIKNQGMLDVLFEYPIQSDQSHFTLYPRFVRLGIRQQTLIRFVAPDGRIRFFELHGDQGPILLEPQWFEAAWRFAIDGFWHILDGAEHVLFLFCLLIPFRRLSALWPIITSFVIAHTLALVASVYDMTPAALWFPTFVDTLMAASILYMAFENIIGPRLERRWILTFAFGLVHGFAFAFALQQTIQFAGDHVLVSIVAFNLGLEAGLVLLTVLLVPSLTLLFRYGIAERLGTIILSVLVGHTAWHWTWDRYSQLVQYQFAWPAMDAAFLAIVLRWMMVLVVMVSAGWIIHGAARRGEISET